MENQPDSVTEKPTRFLRLQGLACDWSKHNKHSRNIFSVHGFLPLSVKQHINTAISMKPRRLRWVSPSVIKKKKLTHFRDLRKECNFSCVHKKRERNIDKILLKYIRGISYTS